LIESIVFSTAGTELNTVLISVRKVVNGAARFEFSAKVTKLSTASFSRFLL